MKIIFNTKEVASRDIPKDVFMYLLSMYLGAPLLERTKDWAWKHGYTNMEDNEGRRYTLSIDGINLIKRVMVASDTPDSKSDEDYMGLAQSLMDVYPLGKKPGTYTMWRGSLIQVIDSLRCLEHKTGQELDKEKAIKATKAYIKGFQADDTYMQTLPNFIFKETGNEGKLMEWQSNLQTYIENENND